MGDEAPRAVVVLGAPGAGVTILAGALAASAGCGWGAAGRTRG